MLSDISYYTSEALTLLHSLIGIPSISREEEAAADFLQNYIEESGIMTGRSGNNIWCISPMFDTNRPTILLNSHIDTVKPVNGWQGRHRKRFAPIAPDCIGSGRRTYRDAACHCRERFDGA